MSENELLLEIVFEGDVVLEATLERIRAPFIVEEIKFKLPIEGRAAMMRGEMQIILGIGRGNRKATKNVEKGDVAYMPLGDALCIYLKDTTTYSAVNVLGKITSKEDELKKLETVRRGCRAIIRLRE